MKIIKLNSKQKKRFDDYQDMGFDRELALEAADMNLDASRSKKYSGGGWCSSWGPFDYWTYGTAASKKPIDFLEGDTMICSVETQGPTCAHKLVQYKMDNQSFLRSAGSQGVVARRAP